MPISWQGNVEQYAGRLNRDYDGKQDVIIFDYIDAHVPTLELMYHKRLRAYRQSEVHGNAYRRPQVYAPLAGEAVLPPFVRLDRRP